MDEEKKHDQLQETMGEQPIIDLGSSLIRSEKGTVYVLTIVGQIEDISFCRPQPRPRSMSTFSPCLPWWRRTSRWTVCSFC